MNLHFKFSRTFSLLILVIVLGYFLLPNILGSLHFKQFSELEEKEYQRYQQQIDDRVKAVSLSIEVLGLPDRNLAACVARSAMKYSRIHPMNSGGIDSVQELESLRCANGNIEDISGIEKMTGLKYIVLNGNKISQIGNIGRIPELVELNLENNALTGADFSSLAGLKNLETLLLKDNEAIDLNFLLKMPALKTVSLPVVKNIYCSDLENLVYGSCFTVLNFNRYAECKGKYTSRYSELMTKKMAGVKLAIEEEIEVTEYELDDMKRQSLKPCRKRS